MTERRFHSGTETQRLVWRSVVSESGRSEFDCNSPDDAASQAYRSVSQSPKTNSTYGSEDNSRSINETFSNGRAKVTLPGIKWVTGEVTDGNVPLWNDKGSSHSSVLPGHVPPCAPEPQPSIYCRDGLDGRYLTQTKYNNLGRSYSQSPSDEASFASDLAIRRAYEGSTNPSPIRSVNTPRSEQSGRPLPVSYVDIRMVEGEGMCYIYDDGTYCPTFVNGEWVNPEHKLTKTGRPRRRLKEACKSCHSKKVKCKPGYTKCDHCAKAHLECE